MAFPSTPGLCCHRHVAANQVVDVAGSASPSVDLVSPAADRALVGLGVDGGVVVPGSFVDREVVDDCVADCHVDAGGGQADGGRAVADHVDDREVVGRVEDDHVDFVEDDHVHQIEVVSLYAVPS